MGLYPRKEGPPKSLKLDPLANDGLFELDDDLDCVVEVRAEWHAG